MPAPEYCFLWIDWWPLCMTKAEWSGWAQAIGSFIAIGIAIAVPWAQRRAAASDETRQRLMSAVQGWTALRDIAEHARRNVGMMLKLLDEGSPQFNPSIGLEGVPRTINILARISLLDLPDAEAADTAMKIDDILQEFVEYLRVMSPPPDKTDRSTLTMVNDHLGEVAMRCHLRAEALNMQLSRFR